jgi:hypothetical protein
MRHNTIRWKVTESREEVLHYIFTYIVGKVGRYNVEKFNNYSSPLFRSFNNSLTNRLQKYKF